MMKLKAVYVSIVVLLLVSCNNSKKEFISFNDILVESKNSIDSCFVSYNKDIVRILNDSLYQTIPDPSKALETRVDNEIIKVQNLKCPVYGDSLKANMLSYYRSIINLSNSYNGYTLLSSDSLSIEQLDSIKTNISMAEDDMTKALSLLMLSQKEFAKKANIKLENDK